MIDPNTSRAPAPILWRRSVRPVAYQTAIALMEARVAAIRAGRAQQLVWLLEHPPLYTAGTGARAEELIDPKRLPVFKSGRGGRYTYHGPGQRIAYVMLDLERSGRDLRCHVWRLEEWMIRTLARFAVTGERRDGRIGVWVAGRAGRDDKIAAIGVRVRHWVSYHGVALNIDPDLDQYRGIVPCGISEHGVTSLAALGIAARTADIDRALRAAFDEVFGMSSPALRNGGELRTPPTPPISDRTR